MKPRSHGDRLPAARSAIRMGTWNGRLVLHRVNASVCFTASTKPISFMQAAASTRAPTVLGKGASVLFTSCTNADRLQRSVDATAALRERRLKGGKG